MPAPARDDLSAPLAPEPAVDPLIGVSRRAFVPLVRFGQGVKATAFGLALAWTLLGHASALDLGLLAGSYFLTMLGITAGFHRLLAHGSFEARPWLRRVLTALGTMAGQGGPLIWVAVHRQHHQFSDKPGDPHSPQAGPQRPGSLGALWHAQVGWILAHYPAGLARYVPDLLAEPWLVRMHHQAMTWVHLGILAPALVGLAATHSWQGALSAAVFGGWARLFLVELSTSAVNSLGHTFGRQAFETGDSSRNAWPLALLTLGDGWHNNHHAFPGSARHGLARSQLDLTWLLIRAGQRLGWLDRVVTPDPALIARRRPEPQEPAA